MVKLVEMRNPWGSEGYTGPWSDSSDLWTPELRQTVEAATGHGSANDNGIFYMDIDSFKRNFDDTQINQDTTGWSFDHFLMFDDPETTTVSHSYCDGCTKHILNVKNEGAAQNIHIGAHVWQDRTYGSKAPDCAEA